MCYNKYSEREVIKNESFDGFGINNVCDNGNSLGLRNCLCYKNFIRKIIKKRLDKSHGMCYNKYSEREVIKMKMRYDCEFDKLFDEAVEELEREAEKNNEKN